MRTSAGLLLHRERDGTREVLLGHMGGPLWARRDERAWTIVKGEYDPEAEDPLVAARREFLEETGSAAPDGELLDLGEIRQSGGKRVRAWALAADFDPAAHHPGTFTMEWPPRSGRTAEFPELDRLAWWDLGRARDKVIAAQAALIDRLEAVLRGEGAADGGQGTII